MNGNCIPPFLCIILWSALPLHSQNPPTRPLATEDLFYRGESSDFLETVAEEYQQFDDFLIGLNSASVNELEVSGLFTAYQINSLLEYRDKYGPFYSIYELFLLPGFHPDFIEQIKSFIYLDTVGMAEGSRSGRHWALLTLERKFPGESPPLYRGSMFKSTLRLRSRPTKNLSLALTCEKDPGESLLYQKSPQFFSGFVSYEGDRFLKQLVLGNYKMNQGLGLVNGFGFMHRVEDLQVNHLSLSRIKPYASTSESHFEQGIACRVGSGPVEILLWGSYHHFSITPSSLTEYKNPVQWYDYQLTTGLFRTDDEMEARGLAFRLGAGVQVVCTLRNLKVGIMNGYERIGASKKGLKLLNEVPDPDMPGVLSVHASWQKNKLQFSGEVASSQFHSLAFLLNTSCQFNDFIHGSLLVHHYSPEYRGSQASTYASGSRICNEQGFALHLHLETGRRVRTDFTGELFRYPAPRHLCMVPSWAHRLDLSLGNASGNRLQWRARIVSRTTQNTPANETFKIRPLRESICNRLDFRVIYAKDDRFRWQSRLVLGFYSRQEMAAPAYAALQQLTLGSSGIVKVTAQFVVFHVSDWENRIYLYEPSLYYSFRCPPCYGEGQKTILLLTIRPVNALNISLKIAGTKSNKKSDWEAGLQVRISL